MTVSRDEAASLWAVGRVGDGWGGGRGENGKGGAEAARAPLVVTASELRHVI